MAPAPGSVAITGKRIYFSTFGGARRLKAAEVEGRVILTKMLAAEAARVARVAAGPRGCRGS